MNQTDDTIQNSTDHQEDFDELQEEIEELETQEEDDNNGDTSPIKDDTGDSELSRLKDLLARTQADYQNYKMRSERDREDMIFYLKLDIFKRILPRIDDIDRMVKNTPDDHKVGGVYEGLLALQKTFLKDLENMGVKPFDSIGQEVDPERHEVMTQITSDTPGLIVEEFERGYTLGERVLRVAKVVVGQ